MNILIVHNLYSRRGGEERAVEMQRAIFEQQGHSVTLYLRDYHEIKRNLWGKIRSLMLSITNRKVALEIDDIVVSKSIDVVAVHNIYPIISPYFLKLIGKRSVKIVMILHNYRLICPTGLFLRSGRPCERCGGGVRELNCALYRCEGSLLGSVAYAARGYAARVRSLINNNVNNFVATTEFQRDKLIGYGYDSSKIEVIHNFTDFTEAVDNTAVRDGSLLYVGRLSVEKGYQVLFEAARKLPHLKFKVAGYYDDAARKLAPKNVELLGELDRDAIAMLYRQSSLLVYPTLCYESFPLTILEAGVNYLPILASNIGATASIIKSGENGWLFEVGSVESLYENIEYLLANDQILEKLAKNNYETILTKYDKSSYKVKFDALIQKRK